jgi:hypothetical protein
MCSVCVFMCHFNLLSRVFVSVQYKLFFQCSQLMLTVSLVFRSFSLSVSTVSVTLWIFFVFYRQVFLERDWHFCIFLGTCIVRLTHFECNVQCSMFKHAHALLLALAFVSLVIFSYFFWEWNANSKCSYL